jgi:gliding motility-associated-like protein
MIRSSRLTKWAILLPLFLTIFGVQVTMASHIVGGDAYYTCLGNNQYQVTFALYRDCSGISMDANLFTTVSAPGCGTSFNVTLQPGARFGVEITPVCPSQLPTTTCANLNGAIQGTQVYEYTGIITLPAACDMWTISWTTCCRNGNITNGLANSMYIETRINNTNGICNNSARFTSLPTPYICAGQQFSFNHGAIDVDGDTLIYSMISPMETSATTFYTFTGGATPTQPFFTTPAASMQFNSNTGQMSFTPSGAQTAIAAVRVYEIRNGDTIGVTMRDIQVVVLPNCTNTSVSGSSPVVSAGGTFDPITRSFVVCQCTDLDFVIHASDPDGDTLTLDPIQSNIGTVFGPSNVVVFPVYPIPNRRDTLDLYIRIRTCDAPLGVNGFTIVITDNACPIPLPVYLGFNVIIPGVNIVASDTAICAGIAQTIQLGAQTFSTSNASVPGTYNWVQISGPPSVISNPLINNPTISVPGTTVPGDQIRVAVQFITTPDPVTGASCITADTVVISMVNLPLNLLVATNDSTLCQNGLPTAIQFSTSITGPGINLVNGIYTWSGIPTTRVNDLSSTTINNPIGQIAGNAGDSASYIVQYAYGACVGRDTVEVYFNPGSPIATPAIDTICPGDTIQLSAVLSDTFIIFNPICDDYTLSNIPYAPIAGTGTNTGLVCDDCLSTALPIGFTFNFYCTPYTQFLAGSNGFITFDLGSFASGCCSGGVLPNATDPDNLIALLWEDLNPGTGGTVTYFTTGIAPNRRLAVNYNSVAFFGGGGTVTGQIVLHETTNIIDIFISPMTPPGTFDLMTMGIESSAGTFGESVPGRNGQNFSIPTTEGWRFVPVPNAIFAPITYQWTPNTLISNDTIRNPIVFPSGNITYYVDISEGNCVMRDSSVIVVNSNIPAPIVNCGNPVNYPTEILFEWGGSVGATGWSYSIDSGVNFISVPLSQDSLLLTGFTNGDCFQIQVRANGAAGLCPTNAATLQTCCTSPCVNPTQINSTAFTNLSCFESNNGTITFLATQGDEGPNYTMTLFNAVNGLTVEGPSISATGTIVFDSLAIGSYYVYGQDAFGCVATSDTVTLTQPTLLESNLVATTLTSCWNTSDGSATVTQVGGTAPYNYIWSDASAQTTTTAIGLPMGNYNAVVIDNQGCRDTVSNINVFGPFAQAPFVSLVVNPSSGCPGNGNATILSVQSMAGNPIPGGPGSLSYVWANQLGLVIASDVLSVQNLVAGNYFITVTDTSGCVFIDTFTVAGAQIQIDAAVVTNPDCNFNNNGSIALTVSGDIGYNYFWSNGATTGNITGLGAGTYSVTVVGFSGCQDTASYTLSSGGLSISVVDYEGRICNGASNGYINIDTSTFGGGTINYLWSNGAVTQNVSGLSAGTYTVTVSLSGSTICADDDRTVSVTILESSPLQANAGVVNCGGFIAAPNGGWATSYSFEWSTGDTTSQISGVAPGSYAVTITDGEGCTTSDSVSYSIPNLDAFIGTIPGIVLDSIFEGLTAPMSAGTITPELGVNYTWTPAVNVTSPNTAQTSSINTLTDSTYIFIVTADNGVCQSYDTLTLVLESIDFTGLPEAFSPNGDGVNDMFRPTPYPTTNVEILDFMIYNRWGQLVYKAENQQDAVDGWDGNFNGVQQPRDIYIFVFSYRIPGDPTIYTIRGQVTLFR